MIQTLKKLKVADLTGKVITLKRTWTSCTNDVIRKGTEVNVIWHGNYQDKYEAIIILKGTRRLVIPVSFVDPTANTRYVINKVLLRKLVKMNEVDREDWFREQQFKIDFDLFRKVYNQMSIEALHNKEFTYHNDLISLMAHAESWKPLD